MRKVWGYSPLPHKPVLRSKRIPAIGPPFLMPSRKLSDFQIFRYPQNSVQYVFCDKIRLKGKFLRLIPSLAGKNQNPFCADVSRKLNIRTLIPYNVSVARADSVLGNRPCDKGCPRLPAIAPVLGRVRAIVYPVYASPGETEKFQHFFIHAVQSLV